MSGHDSVFFIKADGGLQAADPRSEGQETPLQTAKSLRKEHRPEAALLRPRDPSWASFSHEHTHLGGRPGRVSWRK